MFNNNAKIILFFSLNVFIHLIGSAEPLWLPQQPSLRFYNNDPIKLKPGSFEHLVNRWQKRLQNSWSNFYNKLMDETGVTEQQINTYIHDESIIRIYNALKEKDLLTTYGYTTEEDSDPEIINFIKRIISKYSHKKNIKILLSSNINTITATFGSDTTTHYLICNANIYTTENIQLFYSGMANSDGTFYIEQTSKTKLRFIELSNFLLIGLIEALSHIQHQSNLFTFFISNFKLADRKPQQSTIEHCWYLTEIRGLIESILQSKNPLETALFIRATRTRTDNESILWKKLIHELADCYTPESLEFFKASIEDINTLYLN